MPLTEAAWLSGDVHAEQVSVLAGVRHIEAFSRDEGLLVDHASTMRFQGFVNAVDNPLRRGFIRDMSSDRELPNSVALNSTLATVYRTVGPALGGMTIAAFGTLWCFAANAVSYIAVFISLYGIDKSRLSLGPR